MNVVTIDRVERESYTLVNKGAVLFSGSIHTSNLINNNKIYKDSLKTHIV